MTDTDSFHLVDFASRAFPGFRNHVVPVREVPALIETYRDWEAYCTYFTFDSGLRKWMDGNGGSVGGYQGPCYADFLPLDIDSENLDRALRTARELCVFMLDYWNAPEEGVIPYFSGKKGFHVTVSSEFFGGVEPSENLPGVFQSLREELVRQARVHYPETVDQAIGDRLRLLRLPNTRHADTGLYKVALTPRELLQEDVAAIVDMAREPRRMHYTDATGLRPRYTLHELPDAGDLFEQASEKAGEREAYRRELPDPEDFLSKGSPRDFLCDAELVLYNEGVPRGDRTHTALRLASRMRSAGYDRREAEEMVASWNERNHPPERENEIRRIVAGAYSVEAPYNFGCGRGEEDPPGTRLVFQACPYEDRTECETYAKFLARRRR